LGAQQVTSLQTLTKTIITLTHDKRTNTKTREFKKFEDEIIKGIALKV
jgi:hypothetical protein